MKGTLYQPLMSTNEIELLESYLGVDKVMLEWGTGWSTIQFAQKVKEIYSIDDDKEWYDKITKYAEEAAAEGLDNINLYLAESTSGNTYHHDEEILNTEFGKEEYKSYIKRPQYLKPKTFDVILVDGRARKWCALQALKYMNDDSVMMIHDYFNRDYYKEVEEEFDLIDSSQVDQQTLAIFKKK